MGQNRLWYGEFVPDNAAVTSTNNTMAITQLINDITALGTKNVTFNDATQVLSITDSNGVTINHNTVETGTLIGVISAITKNTNFPTTRDDGSALQIDDWIIIQVGDQTNPKGIYRYDGAAFVFVDVFATAPGLRGAPVATIADLIALTPNVFEIRKVTATNEIYVFEINVSAIASGDSRNIAGNGTNNGAPVAGLWVRVQPTLLTDAVTDVTALALVPPIADTLVRVKAAKQMFIFDPADTTGIPSTIVTTGTWVLASEITYAGTTVLKAILVDPAILIATASSQFDTANTAANALTNSTTLGWGNNGIELTSFFQVEFAPNATVIPITSMTLYRSSAQSGGWNSTQYSPVSFNIAGSMDGITWTKLNGWVNQVIAPNAPATTYNWTNTTAYKFYRIGSMVSAGFGNLINLTQVKFFSEIGIGSYLKAPQATSSAILALPTPDDGEVRQNLAALPNLEFYVHNTGQTTGVNGTKWKLLQTGSQSTTRPTSMILFFDTAQFIVIGAKPFTHLPISRALFLSNDLGYFVTDVIHNDLTGNYPRFPSTGSVDITIALQTGINQAPSAIDFNVNIYPLLPNSTTTSTTPSSTLQFRTSPISTGDVISRTFTGVDVTAGSTLEIVPINGTVDCVTNQRSTYINITYRTETLAPHATVTPTPPPLRGTPPPPGGAPII